MNQILFDKNVSKQKSYIFKIQFILSIILAIVFAFYIYMNYSENENLESISKIIDKNFELSKIYEVQKTSNNSQMFFGKIIIDKINLEYSVFNMYNEDLLKISPCKFYGSQLGEKGNICIAAHNYNDNRFFSRIDELKIKDTIKLINLENLEYEYIIYDIFETEENDFSILKKNKNFELTLLTCNNSNKKRIIVKAYMKEY
ncbi:MAG: sortase [Clostridia bacterium]|nr:sortase [Clostridia bacterium]